jgi:hypothetical protein
MRATVQKLNQMFHYCDALSENQILFIFRPPEFGMHIGDVIEFDEEQLDEPQTAVNITSGGSFTLEIWRQNVHRLRIHSGQRTVPSPLAENLETA